MARQRTDNTPPQPHKLPSQARAVFTVETLYDSFVRIWRRDGPDAATTRAIAEESGYAVGTLYEYFPNRTALLSGYVRYCMDWLCTALQEGNKVREGDDWPTRLQRLVSITLDEHGQAPYFDRPMLQMENTIANPTRHQQTFQQLVQTWSACISQWPDYPGPVDEITLNTLVLTLWGGRRYSFLVDAGDDMGRRVEQSTRMAQALLAAESR